VFRVRGDVIDIFPAENAETRGAHPCSTTRSNHLTLFDPLTGHLRHKLGALHGVSVQPLRHAARHGAAARSRRSRRNCAERIEFFQRNQQAGGGQRIEQRTRFDLEMLNELGFCKGIENYSRHLSGRGRASRRRR
jgi:excinuclease ABC subunit B